MGWVNGEYFYTTGVLRAIAANYLTLYNGFPVSWRKDEYDLTNIAEYKADFDRALNAIGKGAWAGKLMPWTFYRRYGRCQRTVIANILGITDYELSLQGFYGIGRLRGYAYYLMCRQLNKGGYNVKE